MSLHVVIGPPCSGKTSWVLSRAAPDDVVIDYDRIAVALAGPGANEHGHRRPFALVVFRAREAALREALRHADALTVYIIHSVPKPDALSLYARHGAEIVTLDPGRAVIEERCRRLRPDDSMGAVRRWYASRAARVQTPARRPDATDGRQSREW